MQQMQKKYEDLITQVKINKQRDRNEREELRTLMLRIIP